MSQETPQPNEAELRAELARVSQKLYSTEDPDIRGALQARVGELQKILGIDVAKISVTESPELLLTPKVERNKDKGKERTTMADLQALVAMQTAKVRKEAQAEVEVFDESLADAVSTPEQIEAAEKLIQQARVEGLRNNRERARELLEEAAKVAPGSSTVQEMVGDDYAERKLLSKALSAYRRAVKLDPKNVNAERKLATVALALESGNTAPTSSMLDERAVPMASRRGAFFLSIFLPGLGHIVLGQTAKGWTILTLWVISVAWLILSGGDLAKLFALAGGGHTNPNYLVLVPLGLVLVLFCTTLADFKKPKDEYRSGPIERPRPPVDLPFE